MVSRIRYPHITNRVLRGQRSFGHVVAVVFFFVALMVARSYAIADRRLGLRPLRADPSGVGKMGRAAESRGADFLEGQWASGLGIGG